MTGLVGYWNVLTKLPVAKLLYNLAAPCEDTDNNLDDLGICPTKIEEIPSVLGRLLSAFLIKGLLTNLPLRVVRCFFSLFFSFPLSFFFFCPD